MGGGYFLEITMGGMAGQAQGVVSIGCVRKVIISNFQRGWPCIQGVGIVACVAGELFDLVVVMGGPAQPTKVKCFTT